MFLSNVKESLPQFFCALHLKKYELKKIYISQHYLPLHRDTALHRNRCYRLWLYVVRYLSVTCWLKN